jgi:NAD(P)-dependent dehydrogenase (short-subunit alcohol dehydrogenase family)
MTTSHENSELAVVTGASSGMGNATARELAHRGFHVLAGVRRSEDAQSLQLPGIEPVILDITNPADIRALSERVSPDSEGRSLRVLINNAGSAANAPVETLPLDEWRRQFEINLFGHIALTQALLPALHHSGGRIINISSTGGKVVMPAYGAYSGAKFAMEAVSDALRRELAPQGVQVVVVEPGAVRTAMGESGGAKARELIDAMTDTQKSRYGILMETFLAHSKAFTASGISAEKAAQTIADAATARRPRTRYTIGRDAALLTRLARLLPDRALDAAIARTLRPHVPAAA